MSTPKIDRPINIIMADKESYVIMKDLQGYFKPGQRKLIFMNARSNRDKILIRLLWITGRRITEVLSIKVHEINLDSKAITIHVEKKTKKIIDQNGNKIRIKKDHRSLSYIDDKTLAMLKHYISHEGLVKQDYLFRSPYNKYKPITRQRAFDIIRETCLLAGIDRVGESSPHPHHFRHSYAIDQAKKMKTPSDVRKLQMMMDHSTLAVTEQYLKFADEELKGFVENVGE